jgi:hypothetical protein
MFHVAPAEQCGAVPAADGLGKPSRQWLRRGRAREPMQSSESSPTTSSDPGSPAADRRAGRERRLRPRTPVFAAVTLRLAAAGQHGSKLIPAHLVDISATGVGVRTLCPIAPGSEFTLELTSATLSTFRVRVARCVELGACDYHIGAAFVRKRESPGDSTRGR